MKMKTRRFIIAVAICSSYLILLSLIHLCPNRQSTVRYAQVAARENEAETKVYHNRSSVLDTEKVTEAKKRPYDRTLSARMIGGLGNQLWIYASVYALAKKTNRQLVACCVYDMHTIFSNLSIVEILKDEECLEGSEILNRSVQMEAFPSYLSYDAGLPQLLKTHSPQHVFLCCYLQNLGYFVEYMEEIRAQLIIRDSLQQQAQDFIRDLLNRVARDTNRIIGHNQKGEVLLDGESPVLVTVHVRRSTMLKKKTVYQPGPSYFKQAMGIYRRKYGARTVFVVATDDLVWCKNNIQGPDVYFTGDRGRKSMEDEFAIAAACNHTVLSVGTFGWWMGFVTGGEVVYIENWVLGRWKRFYVPQQYFLESWTGLTVDESSTNDTSVGHP